MTTRTHFTFRIDLWTFVEHLAGVEDYQLALATYRAACERWPGTPITLRQGARVIEDSRWTRTGFAISCSFGGCVFSFHKRAATASRYSIVRLTSATPPS